VLLRSAPPPARNGWQVGHGVTRLAAGEDAGEARAAVAVVVERSLRGRGRRRRRRPGGEGRRHRPRRPLRSRSGAGLSSPAALRPPPWAGACPVDGPAPSSGRRPCGAGAAVPRLLGKVRLGDLEDWRRGGLRSALRVAARPAPARCTRERDGRAVTGLAHAPLACGAARLPGRRHSARRARRQRRRARAGAHTAPSHGRRSCVSGRAAPPPLRPPPCR
jgi:hypothetical protein